MLTNLDTFTHAGHSFRVTFEADDSGDAPWENDCGTGTVSGWTTRAKKPGERVLNSDRNSRRYYDFAETVARAKREGWSTSPHDQGSKAERAVRAVEADFKRLQAWCNDQWSYIGVIVELLDANGEGTGKTASLWGIESDACDYHEEVARELAEQVLSEANARTAILAKTLGMPYPLG